MTTLLVSQGVPMILSGDEVARTQHGNNNAYCQDNEIAWQPWDLTSEQRAMLEWTRRLMRLRKEHSILRRRDFFEAPPPDGVGTPDIRWLRADGREMSGEQWRDARVRSLAVYESGAAEDEADDEVRPGPGDSLLLLLNSDDRAVSFHLPPTPAGQKWQFVLDTERPEQTEATGRFRGSRRYRLGPRSMAIFKHRTAEVDPPAVTHGETGAPDHLA